MTTAYVGLGSNVGDRVAHLRHGLELLRAVAGVTRCSGVYETEPVGPPQPDFLNAVVEVATDLAPRELLAELKRIEREVGRGPGERWGPREVDLDLLLYAEVHLDTGDLVLPHPLAHERAFVLVPLSEVAPHVRVGEHGTAAELARRIDRSGVRRTRDELT